MGSARGQESKGVPAWQQLARMQSVDAFQQHTKVAITTFVKHKQRLFPTMATVPGAKRKRIHIDVGNPDETLPGPSSASLQETLESCEKMCSHLRCGTRYYSTTFCIDVCAPILLTIIKLILTNVLWQASVYQRLRDEVRVL